MISPESGKYLDHLGVSPYYSSVSSEMIRYVKRGIYEDMGKMQWLACRSSLGDERSFNGCRNTLYQV